MALTKDWAGRGLGRVVLFNGMLPAACCFGQSGYCPSHLRFLIPILPIPVFLSRWEPYYEVIELSSNVKIKDRESDVEYHGCKIGRIPVASLCPSARQVIENAETIGAQAALVDSSWDEL